MGEREPGVGDIVEIHDLGSSVLDTASWHAATVVEIRTEQQDSEGVARIRCLVTGFGDQFWRRLRGDDLRWRWPLVPHG